MQETISPESFYPDYIGKLSDLRSERRGMELWGKLSEHRSSTIRQLACNRAEQKAYYRFLNNGNISEEHFIDESSQGMSELSKGRHLLCLQDTCEINLTKQKGRLNKNSGLGRSEKSDTVHFFKIHPGLVLDIRSLNPLGFSQIKVFDLAEEKPDRIQRRYKQQPIEEKESYKRIEVTQKSKDILKDGARVTFIEDKEGYIYEQFAMVSDGRSHLLVRSGTTRNPGNGNSLYKEVDAEPIAGVYTIDLPADSRKHQYRSRAEIALRFMGCEINCPVNPKNKGYPVTIALSCIWFKEIGKASGAINRKLLTTHRIENYQDALLMVEWYGTRWYIEQLFRILKKQGFRIEQTELENGWAIRKLAIMQMTAMLKILQMNIAYADPEEGQPIEEVFDMEQMEVPGLKNNRLQGKSTKLQNHHDPKRTKWASWVVGRIGGWKGYHSQGPPGVVALKRDMDRLSYIIEGTKLIKDVGTP